MPATLRVLHLVGSIVSDFYYQLSVIYAREVVKLPHVENYYVVVSPDSDWRLGSDLTLLSEKLTFPEAMAQLPAVDLVIPHMFCLPGMTSFRSLFEDILGIPLVGSAANCTGIAANKHQTRSIVSAAGVRVANGHILRPGDLVTLQPPLIIKPNTEDNSLGVTLVRHETEISTALERAFAYDNTLLVEDFIPGRELRVAIIERQGQLYTPAMIEYLVTAEHPIRTVQDKLQLKADGTPESQPQKPAVRPVCPAVVEEELHQKLVQAAQRAHIALGCRDYSLYDFRVHTETHEPYMLEAGLFWSFSNISMISRMVLEDGENLDEMIAEVWSRAAQRTHGATRQATSIPNKWHPPDVDSTGTARDL